MYTAGGAFAAVFGFYYVNYVSSSVNREGNKTPREYDQGSLGLSEDELSAACDAKAEQYDSEAARLESLSLMWYQRRKLVEQAKGHVLEVGVGTGRNFEYYNFDQCESVTFLDKSGPMLEIAKTKWRHLFPKSQFHDKSPKNTKIAFRRQSTTDTLDFPPGGYDTIVQTISICSMANPAETLAYMGTLLNPESGRLLLLEHGRSHYEWVNRNLDRSAQRHAYEWGCIPNFDIQSILDQSGLVIESVKRPVPWNLGTVWVIEARPKGYLETNK